MAVRSNWVCPFLYEIPGTMSMSKDLSTHSVGRRGRKLNVEIELRRQSDVEEDDNDDPNNHEGYESLWTGFAFPLWLLRSRESLN